MKKILLDCDPGMDDSMAIVLAAKSTNLTLLGITTVNGNYPIDITTKNACKMLELLDRKDIPVARGMSQPMVRKSPSDPFSHGDDGQANARLPEPTLKPIASHAVQKIIALVLDHPHEISIVCTGPLTNLAMAIRQAPEIIPLIKEVVAISGAFGLNQYAFLNATGDTPQSEWNVYVDPEAASIVYASGIPLLAIGLDVATYFDVDFSEQDLRKLQESGRKEAAFLLNAIHFVKQRGYAAYCTIIDCMAIAYCIDPTLMETMKALVGVELKDGLTLGMTVRDGRHHHTWEHLPSIRIAVSANYKAFLDLLVQLVIM